MPVKSIAGCVAARAIWKRGLLLGRLAVGNKHIKCKSLSFAEAPTQVVAVHVVHVR